MNPPSPPLVLPITRSDDPSSSTLERSFISARPSCLVSLRHPSTQDGQTNGSTGSAVGCEDGSIFIFSSLSSRRTPTLPDSRPPSPKYLKSSSLSISSRHTSRSTSPSSMLYNQPPFNVSSRSRIVSGLNTEQVEAPKNYVDFDDEPGRLKDMLKGRGHTTKDKYASDASNSSASTPTSPRENVGNRRKEDPRSLLSVTANQILSPKSPSSAQTHSRLPSQSNTSSRSDAIELRLQIVPACIGLRKHVVGMQAIDDIVVALHSSGDLSVFDLQDGHCHATTSLEAITVQPPVGLDNSHIEHDTWLWKRLEHTIVGDCILLFALGTPDKNVISSGSDAPISRNDNGMYCRVSVFEYRKPLGLQEARLERAGDWRVNADISNIWIGTPTEANTFSLYAVSVDGQFIHQHLLISPQPLSFPHQQNQNPHPGASLSNPFKAMMPKPQEDYAPSEAGKLPLSRIVAVEEINGGTITHEDDTSNGLSMADGAEDLVIGASWSSKGITVLEYSRQSKSASVLLKLAATKIKQVHCIGERKVAISYQNRVETRNLRKVDANNDDLSKDGESGTWDFSLTIDMPTKDVVSRNFGPSGLAYIQAESSVKNLSFWPYSRKPRTIWHSSSHLLSTPSPTAVLPIELEHIVFGYDDGKIRRTSFQDFISGAKNIASGDATSDPALNGLILGLHQVQNPRTKEQLIVGGADDGSIAFWNIKTLHVLARWVVFTMPLARVIDCGHLDEDWPLKGCVLCISMDGTIAVVAIDGLQLLYLIPAAAAPLCSLTIGQDNLLLMYRDRRARLWDAKTKEFWRSMTTDKAQEMIALGGWVTLPLFSELQDHEVLSPLVSLHLIPEYASTLVFNFEKFITESIKRTKTISTSKEQTRQILLILAELRQLLSILLTNTLSAEIDAMCRETLCTQSYPLHITVGLSHAGFTSLYNTMSFSSAWCISPSVSAARLVAICVTLKALGLFQDVSHACDTVFTFYATTPAITREVGFQPPSPIYLAQRWFDGSNEVRSVAKTLFDASILKLADDEVLVCLEQWQKSLPCLQTTEEKESSTAALALFLCGYLAAERYALFPTSALTDISKSIDLYLHDELSPHRVLAIDLCSRGFDIWQHYIDAMGILRALFALGTSMRKESISAQNVAPQARLAILHIASSNTPLFITTLGLDILNPSSMEHRKSVLQIVAFLIRKRPLVLLPNLPRLLEAVVKSLDPNSTGNRDAVLDTATEILGHVVKTFPMIDFHMNTQRLAVGTSEGAMIMYDLKTATRLYVLEGHKERITACSFSPDGRRLITVSLEEGVTLVWKVGSGFTSFFNPGAPPRQGHSGSEPYKTLPFNVGEDANMSLAATLECVRFEWVSERSVRLRIRDSILTFST